MKEIFEKIKPKPILVSRFLDIRKKPEINPITSDFSDVFSNEQNRKHSFEEAQKSFDFVFNKEKFIHNIQQKKNDESFSYLKQIRRLGLILRDMYKLVDSSHKCPKKFNKFLYLLGQYNDQYWISINEENKEELLMNTLDNNIKQPINFIDTQKFKEYVVKILSEMEKLLKEKILPVDKFHTLRKYFRLLANLVQPMAAENYGKSLHALFFFLFKLSTELGDHHDKLTKKGLRGEVNYNKLTIVINPDIISEFARLKPFIERVCGLLK